MNDPEFQVTEASAHARNPRMRYPPIAEHGVIGDLHTVALVAVDGTIDWYCCPTFDSPSVFAAMLDADRGGFFRIAPIEIVSSDATVVAADRVGCGSRAARAITSSSTSPTRTS